MLKYQHIDYYKSNNLLIEVVDISQHDIATTKPFLFSHHKFVFHNCKSDGHFFPPFSNWRKSKVTSSDQQCAALVLVTMSSRCSSILSVNANSSGHSGFVLVGSGEQQWPVKVAARISEKVDWRDDTFTHSWLKFHLYTWPYISESRLNLWGNAEDVRMFVMKGWCF